MSKLFPHDHDINIVQYLSFRVLLNQHWHEAVLIPCENALYQLIQVSFPGHSTILITSSEVRYARWVSEVSSYAKQGIILAHPMSQCKEQFRPITIEKSYLAWDRQMNILSIVRLNNNFVLFVVFCHRFVKNFLCWFVSTFLIVLMRKSLR